MKEGKLNKEHKLLLKNVQIVTVALILQDQMTLLNASLTNQDNVVYVKSVVIEILSQIVLMNCIHIMLTTWIS